ncbi:MAG TPA: hypothetical protein VLW53_14710 [Candidatus Eisenbacteria bacterium]|nr:hypothetical protein [Candidatus Eisenbacteria bacterium]
MIASGVRSARDSAACWASSRARAGSNFAAEPTPFSLSLRMQSSTRPQSESPMSWARHSEFFPPDSLTEEIMG